MQDTAGKMIIVPISAISQANSKKKYTKKQLTSFVEEIEALEQLQPYPILVNGQGKVIVGEKLYEALLVMEREVAQVIVNAKMPEFLQNQVRASDNH
jgi:hypothetical protein